MGFLEIERFSLSFIFLQIINIFLSQDQTPRMPNPSFFSVRHKISVEEQALTGSRYPTRPLLLLLSPKFDPENCSEFQSLRKPSSKDCGKLSYLPFTLSRNVIGWHKYKVSSNKILIILFYRAGVYWIYILPILPSYLGVISNTLPRACIFL